MLSQIDHKTVKQALTLYEAQTIPVGDICKQLGIARSTFYRTVLPLAKQNAQKRTKHV